MGEIHKSGEFITKGEEKTAEVLQQGLPDEWLIICNKLILRRSTFSVFNSKLNTQNCILFPITDYGFIGMEERNV